MAMNKDAALKKFIKQNFNFLTSDDFNRNIYKKKIRDTFFGEHKNKFGNPTIKEICDALIQFQRNRGMPPDSIILQVEELPIFNGIGDNIRQKMFDVLKHEITSYKSSISETDLKRIKKHDAYEAVLKHKKKEIEEAAKEENEKLQRKIDEKKLEYESLPSVLDEKTIPEPAFDAEYELEKPWWERLYLKSNPFPQKDGLSSVDQDLYEAVVVKTKPFMRTLSNLERDESYLYNTAFLLVGNFGYGKTTFMDYLSYYLVHKQILPVRIVCPRSYPDSSGFSNNFFLSLKKKLSDEGLTVVNRQAYAESDIEGQVALLLEELMQKYRGVVLFLDDYHKHESSYKEIFEFLGSLQILKDQFTRGKLNVGFIVSGIYGWNKELLCNPQMSGFFDSGTIDMPEITVKNVVDVFNQRIKAFCYDQHPRSLREDFVKSIFDKAKGATGYRDYLTFIIKQLENNNYAIVNTPIKLTDEELAQIKIDIESCQALSAALDKLIYGSKFKKFTSEQIGKCLEIIVQISLQDGISEEDILFRENSHYFQRLKNSQFLQKRKISEGAFKWVIKFEFQRVFDHIKQKRNKSISDYLLKIYGGKPYHAVAKKQEAEKTDQLAEDKRFFSSIQNKIERPIWDKLMYSLQLYDVVESANIFNSEATKLGKDAISAVDAISHVLFMSDKMQRFYNQAKISEFNERWDLHWFDNEAIQQYLKRQKDYVSNQDRHNYERLIVSVNDVFPVIVKCVKAILEDICTPVQGSVGHMARVAYHSNEERDIFNEVKENYFSTEGIHHHGYLGAITEYLERRFRFFLYSTISLIFGEQYCQDCMPKQAKHYATRNMQSRENYASFYNPFNGITRPQFRQIFRDDTINRFIISELDLAWTSKDWELFFNLFADINIATSHQQIDSFSSLERDKYLRYCKMAEQITAVMNAQIVKLPTKYSYVLQLDGDKTKIHSPEDVLIKYSFKMNNDLKDKEQFTSRFHMVGTNVFYGSKDLYDHGLKTDNFQKIHNNILGKLQKAGYYVEDLLDIEYITSTYDTLYTEFISAISYASLIEKSLELHPWYGSSILIKKPAATKG